MTHHILHNFIVAPAAFGGFGSSLGGGFGASQPAGTSFSFNTPPFGAQTTQPTSAFGGFSSCKFNYIQTFFDKKVE